MPNQYHYPADTPSQSPGTENKSDAVCAILQAIGLPAVRIASGTANVLDFNELFPSLINTSALPNRRLWFVEGVVRHLSPAARDQWETAFSNRNPIQIHVRLNPPGSRPVDSVMRVLTSSGHAPADQSVVCVFIPLTGPYFDHLRQTWMAEEQALERNRIRSALHHEVSQKILGAAFGCKLIADKIANQDENLSAEASNLAELLTQPTGELHKVRTPLPGND